MAAAFVRAWWSVRGDEPADAPRRRARPWATDRFERVVAGDSGASWARRRRSDAGVASEAVAVALTPEDVTPGAIGFSVRIRELISSAAGATTSWSSVELRLLRTPSGWRVDDVVE
ncbi:MAG: hypothetical protein ACYDAD_10160 [Acidimicrobiales bacterium]